MRIIAENENAKVEISIKVSSPGKALTHDEISNVRVHMGERTIEALMCAPFGGFALSNKEIKVV